MIIPYGKQHITDEDIDAVVSVLKSDFLTQGPQVELFEQTFANYIGAKYALAVSNGTAALHLCALSLNVDSNSNVITTPITFAASANCVRYCGGTIHFCDIDPATGLIDIKKLQELIESHPKGYFDGIIPVDFAGYPVDMESIRAIANEHNLWIIEDACHAPGGYFTDSKKKKIRCGSSEYADLAIFSFHPVKHIATGEGGMITTNNQELYQKLLLLRTHGITKKPELLNENHGGWYYEMQTLGYNYRISDILCALGTSQLAKAEQRLSRRINIAEQYDEQLSGVGDLTALSSGTRNLLNGGICHAHHLYVIQTSKRNELYRYLKERQIMAQVHYIPVYRMPYYQELGYSKGLCPDAELYYDKCLSIPMYPSLTDAELTFVIDTIKEFYN